jgi:hypothetical protein
MLMIRTTITAASLLLVGCVTQRVFAEQAEKTPQPIATEVLLQSSSSWKGDQYKYPEGMSLIIVRKSSSSPELNQNHTPMTCQEPHLFKKENFFARFLLPDVPSAL